MRTHTHRNRHRLAAAVLAAGIAVSAAAPATALTGDPEAANTPIGQTASDVLKVPAGTGADIDPLLNDNIDADRSTFQIEGMDGTWYSYPSDGDVAIPAGPGIIIAGLYDGSTVSVYTTDDAALGAYPINYRVQDGDGQWVSDVLTIQVGDSAVETAPVENEAPGADDGVALLGETITRTLESSQYALSQEATDFLISEGYNPGGTVYAAPIEGTNDLEVFIPGPGVTWDRENNLLIRAAVTDPAVEYVDMGASYVLSIPDAEGQDGTVSVVHTSVQIIEPTLAEIADQTVGEGEAITPITPKFTGADSAYGDNAATITIEGTLPEGLTWDKATSTLSGTIADTAGSTDGTAYDLAAVYADGFGNTLRAPFTITVTEEAPVTPTLPAPTVEDDTTTVDLIDGTEFAIPVSGNDTVGTNVSFQDADGMTVGVTDFIDQDGVTRGSVTLVDGQPYLTLADADWTGTGTFEYVGTAQIGSGFDGSGAATVTVRVTDTTPAPVEPTPAPVVGDLPNASFWIGQPIILDPEGDEYANGTAVVTGLPEGVNAEIADGQVVLSGADGVTDAGDYTGALTVTGADGTTVSDEFIISVESPSLTFVGDQTVQEGQQVDVTSGGAFYGPDSAEVVVDGLPGGVTAEVVKEDAFSRIVLNGAPAAGTGSVEGTEYTVTARYTDEFGNEFTEDLVLTVTAPVVVTPEPEPTPEPEEDKGPAPVKPEKPSKGETPGKRPAHSHETGRPDHAGKTGRPHHAQGPVKAEKVSVVITAEEVAPLEAEKSQPPTKAPDEAAAKTAGVAADYNTATDASSPAAQWGLLAGLTALGAAALTAVGIKRTRKA